MNYCLIPGVGLSAPNALVPVTSRPPVALNIFHQSPGMGAKLIPNTPLFNAPSTPLTTIKNHGPKSATKPTFGFTRPG